MFGTAKKFDNIQDYLSESLFEAAPSDLEQTLKFMQEHGVTLSRDQRKALALLETLGGYETIIEAIKRYRQQSMPTVHYRKVIEQMAKAQAAANNPSVVAEGKGKK